PFRASCRIWAGIRHQRPLPRRRVRQEAQHGSHGGDGFGRSPIGRMLHGMEKFTRHLSPKRGWRMIGGIGETEHTNINVHTLHLYHLSSNSPLMHYVNSINTSMLSTWSGL